jgi:arsenite-transporting ATPase
MPPRTILYTGKGGVGKTSVAASTARRCAAAGLRTIVVSTDPAHSLSDSLECELGSTPTACGDKLWGQEVQAQEEMERHWNAVNSWLGEMLTERGVDPISADELTVPPGMDELFSLLQIKAHHESGDYDVIVVDCAPTGETLRLLSFPDVCSWWLEKVFPWERRLHAAARPLARAVLDIKLPSEAVFEDVQRLARNLVAMNVILRDRSQTSIRLVMNPERMVVKEAMRTFTYLNLYGYLTDAVIVNRVFPVETAEGYFAAWREVQQENMELVRSAFAPLPILEAPFFDQEVIGPKQLDRLGDELFADSDAHAVLHHDLSQELTSHNGSAVLRLPLPFAEKGEIDLKKIGLEVVVRVGGQKRTIILPQSLASYRPRGARFEDGALHVTFEKDDDRPGTPEPRPH